MSFDIAFWSKFSAFSLLEMRIAKLKDIIANSRILDESKLDTSKVQLLNKVVIKNLKNGAKMTYTIVPDSEADLKSGKLAISTPIAKGLLGKKIGDTVDISVPSGVMTFEVVEISL